MNPFWPNISSVFSRTYNECHNAPLIEPFVPSSNIWKQSIFTYDKCLELRHGHDNPVNMADITIKKLRNLYIIKMIKIRK